MSRQIEKIRKKARARRKPPAITGSKGLTGSQIGDIRRLRSRKSSKLYKMGAKEFRSWFQKKHGYSYPYRVPRQSIARKK